MAEQDVGRLERAAEFDTHAATYHRFSLLVKWAIIHLASVIAFLVLTFAVGAGWLAGLILGAAIFLGGVYALRHGWAHSSERESGYPT